MKRFAKLLVLALCLPLVARADEASHKTKAEDLIMLLHLDRMSQGVMENAMRQTTAITAQHYGGSIPPNAAASLADFQKKLTTLMEPQLGWTAMKPEYVKLFTDDFTEEQLDSMISFYKSAAGQALLEKLPSIEQSVGQTLQAKVRELQPQVLSMFQEFQKNLPPAPTAPSSATPPTSSTTPPATKTPATPSTSTPK